MSDTPRTDDEEAKRIFWCDDYAVSADFARQLERELAEAREALARERRDGDAICYTLGINRADGLLQVSKMVAAIEEMRREPAEARREIEVWSRRYADLEAQYLELGHSIIERESGITTAESETHSPPRT